MSRKQATHDRILETASRAIRRAGHQGVGVADIMKGAGLTHGGFYAHFENRDALVSEAIHHAGTNSLSALQASIEKQCAKGASAVEALVSAYLSDAHLASPEAGCPIAALLGEVPRQAEVVQQASRDRITAFIATVKAQLPARRPPAAAETLACSLVGALQMARAIGHNKAGKAFLAARRADLIAQYDA